MSINTAKEKYKSLLTPNGRAKICLHDHTLLSHCGQHTLLELVTWAKKYEMQAFAATDHGPAAYMPESEFIFAHWHSLTTRLPKVIEGIRVFKGIEANLMEGGKIDCPDWQFSKGATPLDLVLVGMHNGSDCYEGMDVECNTAAILEGIEKNPWVSAISHPGIKTHPIDLLSVLMAAGEKGIALELNSPSFRDKKTTYEDGLLILETAKKNGFKIMVNSDTHTFSEMGILDHALELLEEADFPLELIINKSIESVEEYISARWKILEEYRS